MNIHILENTTVKKHVKTYKSIEIFVNVNKLTE
jgi:hypothetical protein